MNDYPHMLYQGGDVKQPCRLVADAESEREAGKEGFVRAGAKPEAPAVDTASDEKPAPKRRGRPKKAK